MTGEYEFGGAMATEFERLAVLEDKMEKIEHMLYGNGREGIQDSLIGLVASLKTVKWLIGMLLAIVTISLSLLAIYAEYLESNHRIGESSQSIVQSEARSTRSNY